MGLDQPAVTRIRLAKVRCEHGPEGLTTAVGQFSGSITRDEGDRRSANESFNGESFAREGMFVAKADGDIRCRVVLEATTRSTVGPSAIRGR